MKSLLITVGVFAGLLSSLAGVSPASAASCFGERAQVVASNGLVKVRHGQSVVLRNRGLVEVKAAGSNSICAKGGAVDLRLGGGGSSKVMLGPADDRVLLVGKIKRTERRTIWTGLGNDTVRVTSSPLGLRRTHSSSTRPGTTPNLTSCMPRKSREKWARGYGSGPNTPTSATINKICS